MGRAVRWMRSDRCRGAAGASRGDHQRLRFEGLDRVEVRARGAGARGNVREKRVRNRD